MSVCLLCGGTRRVDVRMSDPQDDYEIPCPDCNPRGDGFSTTELAWVERAHQRNARYHSMSCDCPICDSRNAAADAANDAALEQDESR